jgi:tetrahydromethanopterin S-methyltransferase subunit C
MGWLLTIGIGIVSMIIAAAISGGWLAFIIGVIVAVILVALVGRFAGGNRGAAARV